MALTVPRNVAREAECVRRHVGGESLTAIAATLGVSRERVRQIVRRAGVPLSVTAPIARSARKEVRDRCRVPFSCRCCGRVELVVPSDSRRTGGYCSRTCRRTEKRAELLKHLRALADRMGVTPGQDAINRAGPPSHVDYVRYWGSIRAAQQAAGLTPNSRGRPRTHTTTSFYDPLKPT